MSILKDTINKTKKLATNIIDNAKEAAQKKLEEEKKRREEKERIFWEKFPYENALIIKDDNDFFRKEGDVWE